jgi:hypothetical protein
MRWLILILGVALLSWAFSLGAYGEVPFGAARATFVVT